MQFIKKLFLGLMLFLAIIFTLAILTRLQNDLEETYTNIDLIVTLKDTNGYYRIDLDAVTIQPFSGSYISIDRTPIGINSRLKNPKHSLYAEYLGITNEAGEYVIKTIGRVKQGFWTENGRYLIYVDGYIYRALGLFIPKAIPIWTIHIAEPSTQKSKQLLFNDMNGKPLEILEIHGYIKK